ncbi:MAG TPA: tetratricopeptide repeat protein [Chloroflexi bacterium]|nr:tetratricopeptide repeat protein [Chloroflexota bacterium]
MTTPTALTTRQRLPRKATLWLLAAMLIAGATLIYRSLSTASRSATMTSHTTAIAANAPAAVEQAQVRLQRAPDDPDALAQLGIAWLQQIRLTGDASLYANAQRVIERALALDAHHSDALAARGALALALHDFTGALTWADRLLAVNPYRAAAYGIRTDALVELGRYDAAATALQRMVDLRPDAESYSRVSYLRELYGDSDGALTAMQMAVSSAVPGTEAWLWTLTHVGHLQRSRQRLAEAEAAYRQALTQKPDYAPALAGLAQVLAARGEERQAIDLLAPVAARLPLPEYLVLLGELYAAQGDDARAQQQYDLVRVVQQLNAAAGMAVDLELATFEAAHGEDAALALTQAQAAYAARPTLYAADTLAWALYRNGRYNEAQHYSEEARRLGTRDALLYLHAAEIAAALGDDAGARAMLDQALTINPHPSPLASLQLAALNRRLHANKP